MNKGLPSALPLTDRRAPSTTTTKVTLPIARGDSITLHLFPQDSLLFETVFHLRQSLSPNLELGWWPASLTNLLSLPSTAVILQAYVGCRGSTEALRFVWQLPLSTEPYASS